MLLGINEINIVVFKLLVLELPGSTSVLGEMLLEFVHVSLELLLPSGFEVDLASDFIWNICYVKENYNHIRLLPSSVLASKSHTMALLTIIVLLWISIFDELFSFINKSTDVIKLVGIVVV